MTICRHCGEQIVVLLDNDGFGRPRYQHVPPPLGMAYTFCGDGSKYPQPLTIEVSV